MCGLAGFWSEGSGGRQAVLAVEAASAAVRTMADRIAHRGPDDQGVWLDAAAGIALAHRRLAILDLSSAGHQPMHAASGRWVVVFNGEIYNHLELRRDLARAGLAPEWRGHSDTETLLAGFDAWGIDRTLRKAVGMLALAVWDRQTRTLILARDRLGEKPLYYGWQGDTFIFGSELKALRAHPMFRAEIDRGAVALLLRYKCIPSPYSVYQGIRKLPPGTLLQVRPGCRDAVPEAYWSAEHAVAEGLADPYRGSADDAIGELGRLLGNAVARQMVADVPLGAFLSGGVDSSTIVALMQSRSARPIKTFAIGFHEERYNEATHARAVAGHLGTDHTELYVSAREALDVIPSLPSLYDEPFADSSQVPTFLLSHLARQHVSVSLSGDAGDELFGGYNRYALAPRLWSLLGHIPRSVGKAAAIGLRAVSSSRWDALTSRLTRALPGRGTPEITGDRIYRVAALLSSVDANALYLGLVSDWPDPVSVVIDGNEPRTVQADAAGWLDELGFSERMMAIDAMTYLPDDILVKVDRAAMSVSLETRMPFLDHEVFEFAWRLPLNLKLRHGRTKWILRQLLYSHVPRELIDRPKMGFGVPIDAWLRGPLREWAEDLLDESRLRREGFFRPEPIRLKWEQHLSGRRNWQHHLWAVLMFQAWHQSVR